MPTTISDAHCHFFSTPFFAALGGDAALAQLGWEPPGTAAALADRGVRGAGSHARGRAGAATAGWGAAGTRRGARGSVGGGARSPSRRARGADCEPAGRRRVG